MRKQPLDAYQAGKRTGRIDAAGHGQAEAARVFGDLHREAAVCVPEDIGGDVMGLALTLFGFGGRAKTDCILCWDRISAQPRLRVTHGLSLVEADRMHVIDTLCSRPSVTLHVGGEWVRICTNISFARMERPPPPFQ